MKTVNVYFKETLDQHAQKSVQSYDLDDPYLIFDAFYILTTGGVGLHLTNGDRAFRRVTIPTPYPAIALPGTATWYDPAVIKRGPIKTKVGLEVDSMDLTLGQLDLQVGSLGLLAAANAGLLDRASVTAMTVFQIPNADVMNPFIPWGFVINFIGRVTQWESGYEGLQLKVASEVELLNVKMPRYVFQPGCHHTLFDAKCGLNKASYAATSSATSGTTKTVLNCGLSQAAGYFDLGTVTFTSGANNGLTRSVKSYTTGVVTLSNPLPNTPAVGDTFTAYPGCDKRKTTCSSKFSNLTKHRAFPYIPAPETAY